MRVVIFCGCKSIPSYVIYNSLFEIFFLRCLL
nr:MAG TPA: hypothetical protein [Caudoviricetes sp.]